MRGFSSKIYYIRTECELAKKNINYHTRLPFIVASFRFNYPMITMQCEVCYEVNEFLIKIISLFSFFYFSFCWTPSMLHMWIRLKHFYFCSLLSSLLLCEKNGEKTSPLSNHNKRNKVLWINHKIDDYFFFWLTSIQCYFNHKSLFHVSFTVCG